MPLIVITAAKTKFQKIFFILIGIPYHPTHTAIVMLDFSLIVTMIYKAPNLARRFAPLNESKSEKTLNKHQIPFNTTRKHFIYVLEHFRERLSTALNGSIGKHTKNVIFRRSQRPLSALSAPGQVTTRLPSAASVRPLVNYFLDE